MGFKERMADRNQVYIVCSYDSVMLDDEEPRRRARLTIKIPGQVKQCSYQTSPNDKESYNILCETELDQNHSTKEQVYYPAEFVTVKTSLNNFKLKMTPTDIIKTAKNNGMTCTMKLTQVQCVKGDDTMLATFYQDKNWLIIIWIKKNDIQTSEDNYAPFMAQNLLRFGFIGSGQDKMSDFIPALANSTGLLAFPRLLDESNGLWNGRDDSPTTVNFFRLGDTSVVILSDVAGLAINHIFSTRRPCCDAYGL